MRKDIDHRILFEEECKEASKKRYLPIKAVSNEGKFKSPSKSASGSNRSSDSKNITNIQPQALSQQMQQMNIK